MWLTYPYANSEVAMSTVLCRGFASRSGSERQLSLKLAEHAAHGDWAIMSRIGWIATTGLVALLLWQTAAAEPLWPSAVSGLLLIVIGVLAGLRLGADSAASYMKDVQRLNKVLDEQNAELQESNAILLKQISSDTPSSWVAS